MHAPASGSTGRTGVLLMAHGTPESLDQMPDYLQRVRGGRPPSPELVAEMRHNYESIGGQSPLTTISQAQAAALQARLGPEVPVALGMRNWHPYIGDVVPSLLAQGVTRVIGIPLAPQVSSFSVQKYDAAARAALPAEVVFEPVGTYHVHPQLIAAFSERVRDAAPRADEEVVFTAHSLPVRSARSGDPYAAQVAQTARAVAAAVGLPRYRRAFQSAGRTPEPWMGLDLGDLIRLRAERGTRHILAVPIGFVCDHTEVLFDIDIQAAEVARACGVGLRRTASLNDSASFITLLEALVRARL